MDKMKLLATRKVAELRGVTRQHIARLVRDGKLMPFAVLDSGAFVFTEDQAKPKASEQ